MIHILLYIICLQSSRLPACALPMECVCEDHNKHSLPEEVFRREVVESYTTAADRHGKNKYQQSLPASLR